MPSLQILWLQRNIIKKIDSDTFIDIRYLETLSLSFNQIGKLADGLFTDQKKLKSLSLSYNRFVHIPKNFTMELSALEKLDLSNNQITGIDRWAFNNSTQLVSLDLRMNAFRKLPEGIFSNLDKLSYIYFDNFKLCSYAQHVRVCHPRGDGISSVQHLLDNIILRISVWIVAIVACVGNLCVFIGRMIVPELNEVNLAKLPKTASFV